MSLLDEQEIMRLKACEKALQKLLPIANLLRDAFDRHTDSKTPKVDAILLDAEKALYAHLEKTN